MITISQLNRIAPKSDENLWVPLLNETFDKFDINTPHRVAAFLAQAAFESYEFTRLVENMRYSAERMIAVWPTRFKTLSLAMPYENNPQKLANCVYANRMGNGDESSNDGWRFRGRGIFHLTGRDNYRSAGCVLGLELSMEPSLVETPEVAAFTAGWFWESKGLNELADYNDDMHFIKITKIINGGINGLSEREKYLRQAQKVLR